MVQIEKGGRMSKYQEALDYLVGELKGCDEAISDFEYRQELNAKREAAEKLLQKLVDRVTPNKPKSEKEIFYLCPICKEFVGDEFDKNNYCPVCGQAIDWSE